MKIKTALKMKNGIKAYTMEELKQNFDVERAVGYLLDGNLLQWLEERYYEDLAAKVSSLDKDAPGIRRRLCEIFDVEYEGAEEEMDADILARLHEKRTKLQKLTNDEEILSHAGQVAFSQEELADLIDEGEVTIYLCGKNFTIPAKIENRTYIGIIDKPEISIAVETKEKLKEKNIVFENVLLPESLREKEKISKPLASDVANHKIQQSYRPSKLLDFMLNDQDRKNTEKLFGVAQSILLNVTFDIDCGSRPLLEAAKASNLKGGLQRYLSRMS